MYSLCLIWNKRWTNCHAWLYKIIQYGIFVYDEIFLISFYSSYLNFRIELFLKIIFMGMYVVVKCKVWYESMWYNKWYEMVCLIIIVYIVIKYICPGAPFWFSQLSFLQYMGICVFSWPIFLVMIVRIQVLYLIIIIIIIIIKSKVWINGHCYD